MLNCLVDNDAGEVKKMAIWWLNWGTDDSTAVNDWEMFKCPDWPALAFYITNINTWHDIISDLTRLNYPVLFSVLTWDKFYPGPNWVGWWATYLILQELAHTQSLSINRWLMYVQQCAGQIRLGLLSFPISPPLLPVLSTGIELAVFTRRSCWNLTILTGCYLSADLSFKCHCL